jgi:U32 family peptidase
MARATVDLEVAADPQGLTVTFPGNLLPPWHYPVAISEAQKHPLMPETLEKEFASTRSEVLAAGRIKAQVRGLLFLPATTLKEARRAFWAWLETQPGLESLKPGQLGLVRFQTMMDSLVFPPPSDAIRTVLPPPGRPSPITYGRLARTLAEADAGIRCEEVILPDFCPETELPTVQEKVRRLVSKGLKRFRVTSLYGFSLFETIPGATLVTGFPLPACNTLAVRELLDRGATRVQAWIELDSEALEAMLATARGALEVFTFGRPPLLTTRATPAILGNVTDGRGLNFEIVREEGVVRLYAQQAYRIPEPDGVNLFMDCSRSRPDESAASSFNYDQEWK